MILEIITFIVFTMSLIIGAFDNVYLGDYSILDIFLSVIYLDITLWGVFTLLSYGRDTKELDGDN